MDPAGLVGIPQDYEATWMADSSPYAGRIDRLVFEDAQGVGIGQHEHRHVFAHPPPKILQVDTSP